MQPAPHSLEARHAFFIRFGGEIGSVDRADRRADDEVRHDALPRQCLEHAHLYGAEAAAAGQHDRCLFAARLRHSLPPTSAPYSPMLDWMQR
jgi:hypothetical protein